VNKQELADRIREAGHATVIEITNGLAAEWEESGQRFSSKVRQTLNGQGHLRRISEAEIGKGIVFFKNEAAITNRKYSLDFLFQLKDLKRDRSLRALEEVMASDERALRGLAEKFYTLVSEGIPMEKVFYPSEQELARFNKIVPHLPGSVDGYSEAIRKIKGLAMEEYIKLSCKTLMALPEDAIVHRHPYEHKEHPVDIDLILILPPEQVARAMRNSHDFKEHTTVKKDKEQPLRYASYRVAGRR